MQMTTYQMVADHAKKTGLSLREAWVDLWGKPRCASCGAQHDNWRSGHPDSYCTECCNAKARAWKKSHPLNEEQAVKARARSYAHVYRDRGVIARQPCEHCGAENAEMHHEDYSKPLDVIWLCRRCHMAHHKASDTAA